MKRRRVKITGIGPVTPAGIGREEFWKGILEPVSRVRAFNKFGEQMGSFVAAHISGFDPKRYTRDFEFPKGTARHSQFAVAGAALAVVDAGLPLDEIRHANCGIVSGSSLLDFGGIGLAMEAVGKRGARGAQARVVYTTTLTVVPELIGDFFGITAKTLAIQTSCCAGMDAVGHAARMVAVGEVDIAICGGTEAPLHQFPLLELRAAGLTPPSSELPSRMSRPFDLWRTTGVVSEGACMFILEPEDSPRKGYCYVSGYAFSNDKPDQICSGLEDSGRMALADAGIRPSDIDSISAWAPGHRMIDRAEASALSRLFGPHINSIPVCSIKGAIGAPLGAAPAIQIASAALGIEDNLLPPTVNWEYPDPDCPLLLSGQARSIYHSSVLINSHGVGDVNASMVLSRC